MTEMVGAMLVRSGDVLLGLRAAHKTFAGHWDIIGGHLEVGESQIVALRRELMEEIGVDLVAVRYLDTLSIDNFPRSSNLHVYGVSSWEGTPSLQNDEHEKLEWFGLDAAACIPNLVTPLYRNIFASLCGRPMPSS